MRKIVNFEQGNGMKKYVIDLVMNVGKKKILIPHEPRIYGLSTTEQQRTLLRKRLNFFWRKFASTKLVVNRR